MKQQEQDSRICEIVTRLNHATEGKWVVDVCDIRADGVLVMEVGCDCHRSHETRKADYDFITNAKEDIGFLLDVIHDMKQREFERDEAASEDIRL